MSPDRMLKERLPTVNFPFTAPAAAFAPPLPQLPAAPLVSIVINNYNYGRFLAAAIDSALQQHYPAIEVIVVDDGSTDESRDVLARYAKTITALYQPNGGQAAALNAGFAHCRGEVVIFLDADDCLLPGVAGQVSAQFHHDPQVSKVQYRMAIMDEQGKMTGQIAPHAHLPLPSGDLRRQVLTFPFDLTWMATSGNAFSARVLREIFPIPVADYPILADYYLAHLTPLFGTVVFLSDVGACYRIHRTNHYASPIATLDLGHVRKNITYAQRTHHHIQQAAGRLGLMQQMPTRPFLSVADLTNRLVSLLFAPAQHPLAEDSLPSLVKLGVRAAWQRFDVRWLMRLLFMGWFIILPLTPRPLARWLAEYFLFPEKRTNLNYMLRIFQRNQYSR